MNDPFPRSGVAFVLAAFALSTGGCDLHNDAVAVGQRQAAFASVPAKGDARTVGTDEAVEDSALTAEVREALLADPQLQSQNVSVETEDSAVTLTGTVDSPALRERATRLAGSIHGVVQVQDKLEVRS